MSLSPGKSLFADRMDLLLIEEMNRLSGVARLTDPSVAALLRVYYAEFVDVSRDTLAEMSNISKSKKPIKERLVPLFWREFSTEIRLLDVKARLCVGRPKYVDPSASCFFDVDPNAPSFTFATTPFRIDGTQRGIFDDISIFEVPSAWIDDSGVVDFSHVDRYLSLGTTVSFYFPGPNHQRWYTFAKGHQFPPSIRCNKKLSLVFNAAVNDQVVSTVFGVDAAVTSCQ
jgi:hypothetical protein